MEKRSVVVCPSCKCKDSWYIQSMGDEKVYQCVECNRYFKVQIIEKAKHEVSAGVRE
jgi:hypothetical protein